MGEVIRTHGSRRVVRPCRVNCVTTGGPLAEKHVAAPYEALKNDLIPRGDAANAQ